MLACFPSTDEDVVVAFIVCFIKKLEVEGGGVGDGVAARGDRVFDGDGLDVGEALQPGC